MSDLQERRVDDEEPGVDATSDEIARTLGTVWQRFSGQRPKSTKVEMGQDVVKCVITERHEPEPDDEAPDDPKLSPAGLKQSATAAITRITGRKVVAFIDKRDENAQVSMQTFLLDRPRQRF